MPRKIESELLYVFINKPDKIRTYRTFDGDLQLPTGKFVVKKTDNGEIEVVEGQDITTGIETVKFQGASYTIEKNEDKVMLTPAPQSLVFEVVEKDGKVDIRPMCNSVRAFIHAEETKGVYGLWKTGDKLTVEKLK